jgi:hypothetical protein
LLGLLFSVIFQKIELCKLFSFSFITKNSYFMRWGSQGRIFYVFVCIRGGP